MYSISIYDSKTARRKTLENTLECYFAAKGIKFRIRSFSVLIDFTRAWGYTDIAFVSVEEGEENAIELSGALLKEHPDTYLYILAHKYNFLDKAMDLRAFRYLEFPADRERLYNSLDIIVNKPNKISFNSEHNRTTLSEDEIVCIYTCGRKTLVLADSGLVYPTSLSVKEWLAKTHGSKNLVCPHYGYIVNVKYVSDFNGVEIILKCKTGKAVTVFASQRKITDFKNKFYTMER